MKKAKPDTDLTDKPKLQIDFAYCPICNTSMSSALRPIDGFRADHQARHSNKEKVDAQQIYPLPYPYVH